MEHPTSITLNRGIKDTLKWKDAESNNYTIKSPYNKLQDLTQREDFEV